MQICHGRLAPQALQKFPLLSVPHILQVHESEDVWEEAGSAFLAFI